MYKSFRLKEGKVRLRYVEKIPGCEGGEALAQGTPGSLAVSKARLDTGAWSSQGQWEVSLPMVGG